MVKSERNAVILINVAIGQEEKVIEKIKEIDVVKDVYQVYGPYDIVLILEADTLEAISEAVSFSIRRLPFVISTMVLVVP